VALSDADRRRARELAAAAPPPSAELIARLRAILAGAEPAQLPRAATPQQDQGGAADAA
jgi:hypothetical protein